MEARTRESPRWGPVSSSADHRWFHCRLYCHTLKLVVEVDGPIHDHQTGDDREREYVLLGRGLTILRFTDDEVLRDLPAVLDRIQAIAR